MFNEGVHCADCETLFRVPGVPGCEKPRASSHLAFDLQHTAGPPAASPTTLSSWKQLAGSFTSFTLQVSVSTFSLGEKPFYDEQHISILWGWGNVFFQERYSAAHSF